MLLVHKKITPEGELGIWKIEESESFFRDKLNLTPSELAQLEQLKGRRRIEWLAVRHLLHQMSGRSIRGAVLKDTFGKPHLENSNWHISISHSHDRAAVIAAPILCGIDIQYFVSKIDRIANRFLRPAEMKSLQDATRLIQLHIYWGAKEALYKAYGRKELDFCKHIFVQPFTHASEKGNIAGYVQKNAARMDFHIRYEKMEDFMLVWAIQGLVTK